MPDGTAEITLKIVSAMGEIDAAQWDACAGPDNPFVCHAFLSSLEDSGSVSAKTGWQPQHLILEDRDGTLLAAAPGYIKGHSYGEYVFDWGWAEAFERAGGHYYPKMQVAVPFTPVTGPRLLVRPCADPARVREILMAGLVELTRKHELSSLHLTFVTEEEYRELGEAGFLQRLGKQFHWHNDGYQTFDDFLGALASRKRKTIRKERREANEEVSFEALTGDALEPRHMDAFYRFYLNTVDKRWAHAYLNAEFYQLLRERMPDKIVLIMASHAGRFVGAALNLVGSDTLFGRTWGCAQRFRMLYFETCFYRAIEYAIDHGLERVEAGAQGPHKIQRGYLPTATYSAHWIRDPRFREAVEHFLTRERESVDEEMAVLTEARSPFRRGPLGGGAARVTLTD